MDFNKVYSALKQARNIIISTHKSPDGDAIGSSTAFYHLLKKMGISSKIILVDKHSSNMNWLMESVKYEVYNETPEEVEKSILEADLVVVLDYNSLHRVDEVGDILSKNKTAFSFMIDHHPYPQEDYFNEMLSITSVGSTCELVFDFMAELGLLEKLNKNIAQALYTGIMTDTGSFRFPNTTAKTHRVIASLIDAGAENSKIHQAVYDNNTVSRLKLLGYCLSEKMEVLQQYKTGIITLTAEELKQFEYKKGDTEGFVNYILSVEGMKLAIFASEKDGIIKMSFRSKGDFPANEIASKYFSGGGHKNAAGGKSESSMKETIEKIKHILPNYESQLKD